MKNRKIIIGIIIAFLIISIGASFGSSNINVSHTVSIILNKLFNIPLMKDVDVNDVSIVWNLRLPRVILAFLVGASLAVSGAVVQSILKNELASPFTLGVSRGSQELARIGDNRPA